MTTIVRSIGALLAQIPLVVYVLWRGVLVTLAFIGWTIGMLIGTLAGSIVAGVKRGYTG